MSIPLNQIAEVTETDSGRDEQEKLSESLSLDQLLEELALETKPKEKNADEFSQIQTELEKLPQIESNLEKQFEENSKKQLLPDKAIKINDPITHRTKKAKEEKDADAGKEWFNMKKKEMTPEIKRDMLIIKNRAVLDRKRHYKKDKWEIPKYFQTGTIIEGNTEYYSARLARRNRGKLLAEEILHDDEGSKYFKRKYHEIQTQRTSGGKKHYRKVKQKRQGY
uniref:Fcf2 pre-rRNA processing C-terminal domain-containing protein n=1 Tax=Candidozyma auris TaxID=498019 RepID=A0A0L0P224_CANAR